MDKPELLLTGPLQADALARLEDAFTLHRLWEAPDADALLTHAGPNVRAMATSGSFGEVDAALLERLPKLEIISNVGVGYDHIDVAAAAARNIVVTNTPGVLDEEVADLTIGLLIATIRRIPQADRFVREGRWAEQSFPLSPTLRGRRVGIVGLGGIGKQIARRLEGFGLPIAYHGRKRQAGVRYDYHATLEGLAAYTNILIVAVPGGADTRGLVGAAVLRALGPDGVLINVARGSVVDEGALVDALADGTIGAAGLDVYEDEPRVPAALLERDNVVLLPHVGSATHVTRAAMARLAADNLLSWNAGQCALTPVHETRNLAKR